MSISPDKPALRAVAWCVILLIPLLLTAGHVPFWARANPTTIENSSISFMLAIQFAASAMLFPWLMPDLRSAFFTILLGIVLIQLAAMFSGATWESIAAAATESVIWMTSLALWNQAIPDRKHQLIAVALTSVLMIGAWTVQYLALEFGSGATPSLGTTNFRIALVANLACALIVSHRLRGKLK